MELELIRQPARKLLSAQLKSLRKKENPANDYSHYILHDGFETSVNLVWCQGMVLEVTNHNDISARISDGTGEALVTTLADIPGGPNWIKIGKYIMVIGTILKVNGHTEIKAMKASDLSGNDVLQEIWDQEVKDFWLHLKNCG